MTRRMNSVHCQTANLINVTITEQSIKRGTVRLNSEAASLAGISVRSLYRKLQEI